MVLISTPDDAQSMPSKPLSELLPNTPAKLDNDVYALIADFFEWLETTWQLPLSAPTQERAPLPTPLALSEEYYSTQDLCHLFGDRLAIVEGMLRRFRILPVRSARGRHGFFLYRTSDLTPLLASWDWKRLMATLEQWWLPFFPPACGTCGRCRKPNASPLARQFYCETHISLTSLRLLFKALLEDIHQCGSIATWWRKRPFTYKAQQSSSWGVVLIYLLDRQLLRLSYDELLQLGPLCNKSHQALTRLWRHRHPQEYEQFLQAIQAANYRSSRTQDYALCVLSLLVLLKNGLSGLAELKRSLSAEEIQHLCQNRQLLTMHLGFGIFLPGPLTTDLRLGHAILDEIRFSFWRYAASHQQRSEKPSWDTGPRHWPQMAMSAIEQALAAPVYEGETAILSRRPESERMRLNNPWHIAQAGEITDTGYALLPSVVQKDIMTYVTYCSQEQHMEPTTMCGRADALMHFFTWLRRQGKIESYPYWTKESAQALFRAYVSEGCAELKASTKQGRCTRLVHFFSTLADLEYPVPPGYHLLTTLGKRGEWQLREVPHEELLDRVFREGVCKISYEPYSRLALAIQYYCGTRVTETCDIHLFSLLEDDEGHAYLLLPRGKSKEERPFPIVELGMGLLLDYMDEIVALRLSPDGTSRTLGKTNYRYLDTDPERANDWQYLFDRVPGGVVKQRGRLSSARVRQTLQEALLIAAKSHPDDLFQEETYHAACQHRRRKGQSCRYFAAEAGITICPRCGSPLSGQLGARCCHHLEEDFLCDGVAQRGEAFCPKCDQPLAKFLPITPHTFRHNSVSRAHRAGVPMAANMQLHGHKTVPMHLRYLHLVLEDTTNEVRQIFVEKRLRDVRQALGSASGQIVEGGIAYTVSLEHYLGLTLQRTLKRRTYGIWGGFWAGALAQRGVASPLSAEDEIVIPEDTYEHTVAQYWYEALGLAVSEVAFEWVTNRKWRAQVPPFLDRQKIEALVQFHLRHIQDSLGSALGLRLMETDILEQRRFLDELAEKLRPWWQHLEAIDQLVEMFAPGGGHAFHKQLPPAEPEA